MENEEIDTLTKADFKFVNGEWYSEPWTIRLEGDFIEAFNGTKYYRGNRNDLEDVISDINTMMRTIK